MSWCVAALLQVRGSEKGPSRLTVELLPAATTCSKYGYRVNWKFCCPQELLRLSQVRSSQKGASRLVMELRPLPSREALALRAQAAAKAATAQAQAQGLERTLWRLAKKGVY